MSHRSLLVATLAIVGLAGATTSVRVDAQAAAAVARPAPRVVIRDSLGTPIPFASVQTRGTNPRVASDSGVALLRVDRADSLKLVARRIGFEPWEGWVRPDSAGDYPVVLRPLPQNVNRVTIYARDTPLARSGFYRRLEESDRGTVRSRFFTPEMIELRSPHRLSSLFDGENLVRVRPVGGRPVLYGTGGTCPMGIVVDGQPMNGTVEEIATRDGQNEVTTNARRYGSGGEGQERAIREFMRNRPSIDDLVTSLAVVAVEIYGSMASAPAELQRSAPREACGLVVVWTGRRAP